MFSYKLREIPIEKLLELYKEGNPDAFTEFYRRTNKFVFNLIRLKVPSQSHAEDVFQDVYLRVHKYILTYDSERKAMVWLTSIARNTLVDFYKANAKKELPDSDAVDLVTVEGSQVDDIKFKDALVQLYKELSEEEAEMVIDRVIHGDSFDELALKYEITSVNARQKITRLFKKLRLTFKGDV